MKNKVKTSISINPQYLEIADNLAKREDRSRSYILDHILEAGLAEAAAEGVENFAQAMSKFRKELKARIDRNANNFKTRAQKLEKKPL